MRSITKRWLSKFILAVCALLLLPLQGYASENADQWNLVLQSKCEGSMLEGVTYHLYYVADAHAKKPYFTLAGDFTNAPVDMNGQDQSQWASLGTTLSGYADTEEIAPLATADSDAKGKAVFQNLDSGVYLVVMEQHEQDGMLYHASAFCVALTEAGIDPQREGHTVTATPKISGKPVEGDTLKRKVVKVWDDKGYESQRPEEITVYLLRDHKTYAKVTLNQANQWSHEWTGLDRTHEWSVQEGYCPGYSVQTQQEGNTFIVTNTYKEVKTVQPKPETPAKEGKLPQTGQMWWPVAAMALGGAVLVLVSAMIRRIGRHE